MRCVFFYFAFVCRRDFVLENDIVLFYYKIVFIDVGDKNMKNYNRLNMLALVGFLTFGGVVSVQAQSAAMDEIAILREDLKILQRQIYRANNEVNPSSAADIAVKLGEFDEQIRKTSGRIDELEYKIKSLEDKINLINKDIDVRISMIEGKPIKNQKANNMPETVPMSSFKPNVAKGAPKSITGEGIDKGEDLAPVKTKSAKELYQDGLNALQNSDYALADQNFNSILKRYPDDALAGNAQYWLGEVYYAKKDWQRAAIAFAKGLEKYKNGPKGADSLLKLGMSMKELKKTAEACQSFTSLKSEFPKAEASILNKAAAEAKKLGCK